ncbi:MAG: hypothetical protein E5W28_01915 [Mesorhizobium sp.]|uniref:hypothetical protein n=1 Tax=Mesorhizobium sp. TaxID=1871066 RepID=UPI000FE5E2A5|nr:hypothetical protein [Mesorhizobium sp.]RWE83476.1 MAG: hypothetical protein EOS63_04955 [Mesorhizobium sp.]TIU41833.1 MAG: hypothetical protein E5W28_01915 [Mesorhizobium sp.]TIU43666.1 MAG: hypothetical protein E5W31_02945 [Mesorhizobium sp.]TJW61344.1 MAG: hypothetical protein E5V97_20825 [Mesorhizobium sp.]
MSDPTTPYGTAKGYVQSALLLMTNPDRFQAETDASFYLSFHMLIGFATELYLKSYLMHVGYQERELRASGVRHNLNSLLAMAEAKGLSDRGAAVLVDLLGEHHQSFEFRYMKEGARYPAMNLRRVFEALSSLNRVVDEAVGASASRGKQPGDGWDFPDDFRQKWR